jgi:cyclopropane fatty-acyl-phospholipid synthase-like methyltransferase
VKDFDDAFGHALYDNWHQDGGDFAVIEREDGYIDFDRVANYFSDYADWPPHQRKAMEYVVGRVLDIGCGAGRHALYLQRQGFQVLATDRSPLAIEVCKSRGLREACVLPITQLSSRLGAFDTILLLGNNFGLFGSVRRGKWLLRRFHSMSPARARIIAESADPYQTENPDHLRYHQQNRARGRAAGQVRIRVRYRKHINPWFDYLLVSKDEMQQVLEGTGWKVSHFLDSEGPSYVAVIGKVGE